MSDPVVLIGIDRENGSLVAVGLYETTAAAQDVVQKGGLPSAFYSVITPAMGTTSMVREPDTPMQFYRRFNGAGFAPEGK